MTSGTRTLRAWPGCFAAALLAMSVAGPAVAATVSCHTTIDGQPYQIFYNDAEPYYSSFRERIFSRDNCPGAVVIAFLTPELTPEEREVFCANYDPRTKSHSLPAQGPRDAYGRCVAPSRTCRVVNATKDQALEIVGLGEDAQSGTLTDRMSSTMSAVTHSSGALILSGNAGTIAGLLPSAGNAVGTALATPSLLAGAAASIVVIGGAVYLCGD
ncbi:hypothetical protein [Yoonia vestfoldensis]|uniref:hypothetical protein n=1 Tax=Yoonia vestfoldensis TaxID=245188 RepID=UPI0013A53655|nr:hypothetical protein [Yoonia vestfoldensis]